MKNNVLENKNCFITGSTGGLGQEISKEMIRRGCNLFLTGRSDKKLQKLSKQLKKTNREVNIWHHKGDLENIDDIKKIVNYAKQKMENIDILFNCAGYFLVKNLIDNDLRDFNKCFNINVRAPYLLCKEFCKGMLEKKWGRIVNIGSSSSYAGFKETTIYCSSKHAILGLSRAMHDEFKKYNIRTFCISPGSIKTDMGKQVKNQDYNTFIEPKEIAEYIGFILSFDENMISEEIRLNRVIIK
jgi:short-subunit dehydrogenase